MVTTTQREATAEEIAQRAYAISESEASGTPEENWWRAEHELRDQQPTGLTGRLRRSATKSTEPNEKPSPARKTKPAAEKKRGSTSKG